MKTYVVNGSLTISVYTEVRAKSAAEAKRIAGSRPVMGLCRQCADGEPGAEWTTTGDLDGEPRGLRVEVTK